MKLRSILFLLLLSSMHSTNALAKIIECKEGRWKGNDITTSNEISDDNSIYYKNTIFLIGKSMPRRGDVISVIYDGEKTPGLVSYSYRSLDDGYLIVDTIPHDILESYIINFRDSSVIAYFTRIEILSPGVRHAAFTKKCITYTISNPND